MPDVVETLAGKDSTSEPGEAAEAGAVARERADLR